MRRHHPVALALLPLVASCSLVLVHAPDPDPPCTESYALPLVDGVIGAGALLTTLFVAISCGLQQPVQSATCHPAEAGLAGGGVLFVTSSIIGSGRVNRCEAARARARTTR